MRNQTALIRTSLALALLGVSSVYAQTRSKTEVITYYDNTAKWVLGQTASVSCTASVPTSTACDGDVISQTTFDPTTALPVQSYRFGVLEQSLTYYSDGTVATVTDGRGNRTSLSDWTRGIPRRITAADGTVQSATVNSLGLPLTVTDELGYTTSYSYDVMGRLSGITYPSGDTVAWAPETFSFTWITTEEHGIAAGHWRSSRRQGNAHHNVYYDAQWRPLLTEAMDASNIAETLQQTITRYDAHGRVVYQSYPARGVDKVSDPWPGIRTTYDALGRVTKTEQDSELGVLTTTTDYLSGFQTRVTSPTGQSTTTAYQTFDQPSTEAPVWIAGPAGVTTTIVRDLYGKPLTITRDGPSD